MGYEKDSEGDLVALISLQLLRVQFEPSFGPILALYWDFFKLGRKISSARPECLLTVALVGISLFHCNSAGALIL